MRQERRKERVRPETEREQKRQEKDAACADKRAPIQEERSSHEPMNRMFIISFVKK